MSVREGDPNGTNGSAFPAADPRFRRCSRDLLRAGARVAARELLDGGGEGESGKPSAGKALDLYGGPLGPALFWAAMARAFPDEAEVHRERSLAGLLPARQHLLEWLDDPRGMTAAGVGLGGLIGVGGAVYALACAGALLDRPELLREARDAVALFTPERIARDRCFDFVEGTAGGLLSLLALERALHALPPGERPRGGLPPAARLCAEHLVARRTPVAGRLRAWVSPEGRVFCGFAHGASGIAHALCCAADRGGDPSWREAAREAIAFEHDLYRPDVGNWPPFPDFPAEQRPMAAWCWGAPGIALARAATFEDLDTPEVRDDLRKGLEATLALRPTLEDHVCCGNLGRAQVLTWCARRPSGIAEISSPETLAEAADRLVFDVLRRVRGRGGFRLSAEDEPAGTSRSGFFKGIAGIGYALLDLADPGELPLPLLLEGPDPALASSQ